MKTFMYPYKEFGIGTDSEISKHLEWFEDVQPNNGLCWNRFDWKHTLVSFVTDTEKGVVETVDYEGIICTKCQQQMNIDKVDPP